MCVVMVVMRDGVELGWFVGGCAGAPGAQGHVLTAPILCPPSCAAPLRLNSFLCSTLDYMVEMPHPPTVDSSLCMPACRVPAG